MILSLQKSSEVDKLENTSVQVSAKDVSIFISEVSNKTELICIIFDKDRKKNTHFINKKCFKNKFFLGWGFFCSLKCIPFFENAPPHFPF